MSYKEKYLKYKSKYLNFKAMINNQSGGGVVDIMNISQLSDTPTETKNKLIGGSKKHKKNKKDKKVFVSDSDSDFISDSSLKSFSSIETESNSST